MGWFKDLFKKKQRGEQKNAIVGLPLSINPKPNAVLLRKCGRLQRLFVMAEDGRGTVEMSAEIAQIQESLKQAGFMPPMDAAEAADAYRNMEEVLINGGV